jgi:hypothetical protein
VALGTLLFLDNVEVFEARRLLRYLPGTVVLGVGLAHFLECRRLTIGVALWFLVGGWLLLDAAGLARFDFWEVFWPLALIGVGISLVRRSARGGGAVVEGGSGETNVRDMALMGGVNRRTNSTALRSVDAVAVMGGVEVDLRQALAAGEEIEVDAFAFWGGVEILVPPTWEVVNKVVAVLGGAEDKSRTSELATGVPRTRVVVRGFAVMGAVEIANEPSST